MVGWWFCAPPSCNLPGVVGWATSPVEFFCEVFKQREHGERRELMTLTYAPWLGGRHHWLGWGSTQQEAELVEWGVCQNSPHIGRLLFAAGALAGRSDCTGAWLGHHPTSVGWALVEFSQMSFSEGSDEQVLPLAC